MKKINLITTLIVGFVLFLGSCQKVETDPRLNVDLSVASAIINPESGSSYVLVLADSANPFTVNWTEATYSVSDGAALPMPTYSLQMAYADSNFTGNKELYNTQDLMFETIVYKFNNTLINFGIPGDSTANIELRVISGISDASYTNDTSDVINLTVTTFKAAEPPPPAETPRLWVPGDYQGWSPGDAPNVWSLLNDGIYTGYVYYPEGGSYEFKFTSAPDWDHTNFGAGASDGLLDSDDGAGNLSVPDFGNYYLTCDTINLVWAHELRTFALIGSFNGWDADEALTWDDANQMFTITMDFDAATEFKWRVNADWTLNLGDSGAGDNTLSQDGDNIILEDAGNYTINLFLGPEVPIYEVIQN